jgi:hypothetical protein
MRQHGNDKGHDHGTRHLGALGLTMGAVGGIAGFTVAAYPGILRQRCLTWGARLEEVARSMPGDGLLPDAPVVSTRAIGVAAPPSAIWPWLVQMGPGRGGAYTYDWIENLLGLNMHSADEILPRFQNLAVGDVLPLNPKVGMRVEVLEEDRALMMRSIDGAWVWSFGLYPEGDAWTRLVSRNRIQDPRTGWVAQAFSMYFMEPGSLVMERKMLRGIKERAERLHTMETIDHEVVARVSAEWERAGGPARSGIG